MPHPESAEHRAARLRRHPSGRVSPRDIPAGARLPVFVAAAPSPEQRKALMDLIGNGEASVDGLIKVAEGVFADWIVQTVALPGYKAVDSAEAITNGLRIALTLDERDFQNLTSMLPLGDAPRREMSDLIFRLSDWAASTKKSYKGAHEANQEAMGRMVSSWKTAARRDPGKGLTRGPGPYQFFKLMYDLLDFRVKGLFPLADPPQLGRFKEAVFDADMWDAELDRADKDRRRLSRLVTRESR